MYVCVLLKNVAIDRHWFYEVYALIIHDVAAVPCSREEEEQQKAYRELRSIIDEQYRPLHPHLYQLQGWEVVEGFREAVESGDQQRMRAILTEETPGQPGMGVLYTCMYRPDPPGLLRESVYKWLCWKRF